MTILKNAFHLLKKFINGKSGNAQLLVMAGAIFSTMAIYLFISISSLNTEDKERITHLYNAYQMGLSINALLKNRIAIKGNTAISYKDEEGQNRFTKAEFEKYVIIDSETIFTLEEMISDQLILDARDPTATRLNGSPTRYDLEKTKIQVIFDLVIDHYDENGDAVKMVSGVQYFVNLAGAPVDSESTDFTNDPYQEGENFYYLVSFVDEDEGLNFEDITLRREGIIFDGVLDSSTFGTGPVPDHVIILPGDTEN